MKKLSTIWLFFFFLTFLSTQSPADEYLYFNFRADILEPGNPGGWTDSLKTFDEEYSVNIGSTAEFDVWAYDVPLPETELITALHSVSYDPEQISILSVEVYDGINGPPGPWDPGFGGIVYDYNGPGTIMISAGNFSCVHPDSDDDVITVKIRFLSEGCGDTAINIYATEAFEPTFWGCGPMSQYWGNYHTITIHQIDPNDNDCDGILNIEDNCPLHYNPNQEDDLPFPDGNGIPDACDCEGNFDCDGDCDGTDAATFKIDFGRSQFQSPCTNQDQCKGDFDCDVDVDGTDAALFKTDFGRSQFSNPCPVCEVVDWCMYP